MQLVRMQQASVRGAVSQVALLLPLLVPPLGEDLDPAPPAEYAREPPDLNVIHMRRLRRGREWHGRMRGIAILLALPIITACAQSPPPGADTVVLVHGLGRGAGSLAILGSRLEAAGFRVVSFDYPSTQEPIEFLVERLSDEVVRCCAESAERVHFVTHSMGGILVRAYLAQQPMPHQGRVVMLGPPTQGSEIIDAFRQTPLLWAVLGPAGARLGTDSMSLPARLPPPAFELGIIAGSRSMNPIGSWLIPGPDDGKVSVQRARLEEASFVVVPGTHTFLMNRQDVADQVIHFLREGRFLDVPS